MLFSIVNRTRRWAKLIVICGCKEWRVERTLQLVNGVWWYFKMVCKPSKYLTIIDVDIVSCCSGRIADELFKMNHGSSIVLFCIPQHKSSMKIRFCPLKKNYGNILWSFNVNFINFDGDVIVRRYMQTAEGFFYFTSNT